MSPKKQTKERAERLRQEGLDSTQMADFLRTFEEPFPAKLPPLEVARFAPGDFVFRVNARDLVRLMIEAGRTE